MKSETHGVGVGLSTADSLTSALGGVFTVKTNPNARESGVEVNFSMFATNLEFIGTFNDDLQVYKNH